MTTPVILLYALATLFVIFCYVFGELLLAFDRRLSAVEKTLGRIRSPFAAPDLGGRREVR